ncbi:hypothetical protein VTI74DRAFT_10455 [Chaetomium olivicolor]
MCLVGLLVSFTLKNKACKHRSRSSGHRHSEHSWREESYHPRTGGSSREESSRRRSDSSHRETSCYRRTERSHREESKPRRLERSRRRDEPSPRRSERLHREQSRQRQEKDMLKDVGLAILSEDAVTRLCPSLDQTIIDEDRRWREQERLDRLERERLGLERGWVYSEEAPPYSAVDTASRPPPPEPQYQTGVANSPDCRRGSSNMASIPSVECCRNCICSRCGFTTMKCPAIPELDGREARITSASPRYTEGGVEVRSRRAWASGPH